MSEYICNTEDKCGMCEAYRTAEPIVRCRDCVGLVETWDGWECERFSGEYHRAEPDGFCSWGEHEDGDTR